MIRPASLLPVILLLAQPASGQDVRAGGSLRWYQFFRLEEVFEFLEARRDTEFGSARGTLEIDFNPQVTFEAHGVLDFLSPPASFASTLARGRQSAFLPLDHDFTNRQDLDLTGRFDRLNLELDFDSWQLIVGRQAISWGVTYFWPALDLFSSFAPQRVDRDYKEGVDAARLIVPVGDFSELQVIAASLGPSAADDGAAAAQLRLGLGRLDLGLMGGKFHRDTVAGVFLTTDAARTALRAEVTWTRSGNRLDRSLGRRVFWRAALGADRQLTPSVGATLEFSYNGFGAGSADRYLTIAGTDRVQRGELNALGTWYTGGALNWQLHPLWVMNQTVLVNWQDPSLLWIPSLQWSTGDNSSVLFAAQSGFGRGVAPDLSIGSEYGTVATTLFAAIRWYF